MSKAWNDLPEGEFRAHIAEFVKRHCPSALRFPKRRLRWSEVKPWYLTLSEAGLLAPNWPAEFGGMGLSPNHALVYLEEMSLNGAPRLPDQGIINLGPLLIEHGNKAQQDHYLPRILAGDHIWCQGYSEPNAGSDLASLRLSAVQEGDEYVINGQKLWTTWAYDATHIFALVRTSREGKKQEGISFLLIALDQPGVTIRPIKTLTGHAEFCGVFFDNARTAASNLVGKKNDGWTVAKALLGFERIWAGSPRQAQLLLAQLERDAKESGKLNDSHWRNRIVQLRLDVADLESLYLSFVKSMREGNKLGQDVSILKVWATETCQRITEAHLELVGDASFLDPENSPAGDAVIDFLESRSFTIYGGTSEIQRNILATRVLHLPQG